MNTLTYSQFLEKVRTGQNAEQTVLPSDYRDAMAAMQDKLVNIEIRDSSSGPLQLLYYSPFILILAVWIFLVRKFQNGPGPSIPWLGSSRH